MQKVRNIGECAVGLALVGAVLLLGYGACGRLVESAMIVAALN
jgi:hypothetical protein